MLTFADFISPIWDETPHELIGDHTRQKIGSVSSFLPGEMASFLFGFECPLGQDDPHADLQLSVGTLHNGPAILLHLARKNSLAAGSTKNSAWQRIQQFAGLWADPTSTVYKGISGIWLEFDIDSVDLKCPVPSFFFSPNVNRNIQDSIQPEKYSARRYNFAQRLVDCLTNGQCTNSVRNAFQRCWQVLPDKAAIFQIGLMLSRPAENIRVCVKRIAPHMIGDYLCQLGWDSPVDELRQVSEKCFQQFDSIALTFDIGEQVGPKIGLECYFIGKAQPSREPRWHKVMNHLVECGLCTPGKAHAFLKYPGCAPIFPRQIDEGSWLAGDRRPVMAVKGLHHVKITFEPNKPLTAKGYLWAGFRWANVI